MSTDDIQGYYNQGREQGRLLNANGKLEFARTQELIRRYLPKPPAIIMDIGGGAGIHALWLAKSGYTVHLVDIVPLHIEQALQASAEQPDYPLASAQIGDAQQVNFPDSSADAVLLLGPMYHLPERDQRLKALHEAYRLLKPEGWLFVATISRFASLLDGLMRGFLKDDHFAELMQRDLTDGQHRNPTGQRGYFTTAYFHHPDEIKTELMDAGFDFQTTLAIEGLIGSMPDFDSFWEDEVLRERLLSALRTIEAEPSIIGATGHLMSIGRKGS